MKDAALEALLENVTIHYARRARCDEEWNSIPHVHPYLEVFFVINGCGRLQLENEVEIVRAGDFFFIDSQIRHTELADTDGSFAYYVLGLDGLSLRVSNATAQTNSFLELYTNVQATGRRASRMESILSQLVEEWQSNAPHQSLALRCLLHLFLIEVLRLNEEKLLALGNTEPNKQIEYVKAFIDVHYARALSLDDLADIAYLNKYHLGHEFKRLYQCSPMAYVARRRIEVAKELILTTGHSMEKIAEVVGFNSQAYFNQAFKKHTGQTPSAFKRAYYEQRKPDEPFLENMQ